MKLRNFGRGIETDDLDGESEREFSRILQKHPEGIVFIRDHWPPSMFLEHLAETSEEYALALRHRDNPKLRALLTNLSGERILAYDDAKTGSQRKMIVCYQLIWHPGGKVESFQEVLFLLTANLKKSAEIIGVSHSDLMFQSEGWLRLYVRE